MTGTSNGTNLLQDLTDFKFQIKKSRLLFLKCILEEDQESRTYRFFQAQLQIPTKGDWVSECRKDLTELEIEKTFEEIRKMSISQFKNLLKKKISETA